MHNIYQIIFIIIILFINMPDIRSAEALQIEKKSDSISVASSSLVPIEDDIATVIAREPTPLKKAKALSRAHKLQVEFDKKQEQTQEEEEFKNILALSKIQTSNNQDDDELEIALALSQFKDEPSDANPFISRDEGDKLPNYLVLESVRVERERNWREYEKVQLNRDILNAQLEQLDREIKNRRDEISTLRSKCEDQSVKESFRQHYQEMMLSLEAENKAAEATKQLFYLEYMSTYDESIALLKQLPVSPGFERASKDASSTGQNEKDTQPAIPSSALVLPSSSSTQNAAKDDNM